ncbi:spirocyclase AveC family protein [Mycobacterium sp. GA-2829]|uniref:spirocyclase AveC family protein n=1 Tax=Mycobacterium sp. GA-2829 TaxID=1772283 RepID=UPI0007400B5D|nr:spirocyclase AveC family protein [Mycobacterium sp. GA-2829]KUI36207.1 hypothetical protein AU194_15945 [Mycobacterium sp. GA-2829]
MANTLAPQELSKGFIAKPPRPIVWLAVLGGLFLLLEAWVLTRWITSAEFRPAAVGPDPVPTHTLIAIRVMEIGGVILAIVMIIIAWRSSRREGRLSLEAILMIAFATLWWQDPGISWGRPGFFYNAHFVNMSSWTGFLPGAINPTASRLPEPLLCMGSAYIYGILLAGLFVATVMRRTKRRFPDMPVAGLVATGVGAAMVLDLIVEVIFIRFGLYAYPTTIHSWSLFAGTRWQFPIYESLLWGPVWAAAGMLLYFRDDKGHTFIERGVDRIQSVTWQPVIRILAVVAFMNIVYAVYNVAMIWTTFQAGPMPSDIPSYFVAEQCGAGTDYACPSPDVPIPLPGSGPTR